MEGLVVTGSQSRLGGTICDIGGWRLGPVNSELDSCMPGRPEITGQGHLRGTWQWPTVREM